jgi:uncharacterized protein YuzE
MERKNYSYDEHSDSLIVSCRQENEIVKRNFEVGDIIFSLTGKGKIVGIEIRGASSFLESCNLDPEILINIESVELRVEAKRGTIFILMRILAKEGEHVLSKSIPLVVPVVSQ